MPDTSIEIRKQVLTALEGLLTTTQFDNLKWSELALAANLSTEELTEQFTSFQHIYAALVYEDALACDADQQAIMETEPNPIVALQMAAQSQMAMIEKRDRRIWRSFVAAYFANEPFALEVYHFLDERGHTRLEQGFAGAQQMGLLDTAVDARILAHNAYAISDNAVLQYVSQPSMKMADIQARVSMQLMTLVGPYLGSAS
ncbi:MAG: hypothetical protein AAF541_20315 [Pseudomonadota bacterium]